jgi:hypothetical protein
MRTHLRHKAAEEVWKAKDEAIRQGRTEERRLARLREKK